ncbi:glycosyl hydrolase 2 galactose-binding domain-containing protein [Granulicella aggregans]|uniref:glycosyl hydrolase 2 galactose-binding domain-containing protein n=1 Tax=Granulicella aggregans TaxID=474949 RepID=UPI0021E018A3|nr:LamG-like jellyroll fold domain-containing protein [Granulicella aggregans]
MTAQRAGLVAGPFNGYFLRGGIGLSKKLQEHAPILDGRSAWSLGLWFRTDDASATALLAGVGLPDEVSPRFVGLIQGRPFFWSGGGKENLVEGKTALAADIWHSLAVSFDAEGVAHLFADGVPVASKTVVLGRSSNVLSLASVKAPPMAGFAHFGGWLADVTLSDRALVDEDLAGMKQPLAGLNNLPFEEGSKPWPVQTRASAGLQAPQDPATLPHSETPPETPHAVAPLAGKDEATKNRSALILRHGWKMAEASTISAQGAEISRSTYQADSWMAATVPGTVLTTLIDRGVYPDPDFGLNNMAIPESLARKSFWYRDVITVPASMGGRHVELTFLGINYRATIWVNGTRVGEILGAFRHKGFDVTALAQSGQLVVAVRIDPPPHPGIPHEQSIAAGSGPNGGMMMLDGPTFGATEGWDWIPGIRDRNMGLWQDVLLTSRGSVEVQVPRIITHLPLPDTSRAELTVMVPLANSSASSVRGTVEVAFDGVRLAREVTVPPAGTTLTLKPSEFKQLVIENPRLWWPNGYGKPELHTMTLTFRVAGRISDERKERFGIRELTYEISALDSRGKLRRVEVSPTVGQLLGSSFLVNQTHEGFRETPEGWVPTLVPAMEHSVAVKELTDLRTAPFLVLRVNGVRIAAKGGSWGMDDMRKRVSRERLEPYFRLNREAHLNMVRNWMGQDTEITFYDLADEYGLLVWNDFWTSTQDYNLEPTDTQLFLDNAKDVITRYRNHPSIAVWCGRNEGVPPPAINEGLAQIIGDEDGTRYFSADSNKINLHDSGPYKFQEPEDYFTKLSSGFAVEVGIPSPPTLESFKSFLSDKDQWPISDAWAYHDWHQDGNGDVAPFMQTMTEEFGAPTSLADFDRKAQMLNYVEHRAVFEGMNAHLWAPNSGRLLWMTQPAWPSSVWQILSHDYDTHASFYAVRLAAEPVHVQMNLPDYEVVVVNNTERVLNAVTLKARVFDLAGKVLLEKTAALSAEKNAVTLGFRTGLKELLETAGVALVKLELFDANGAMLSSNFYWQANAKGKYRRMDDMPMAKVIATVQMSAPTAGEDHLTVRLTNSGTTPALAAKLTLKNAASGERILPAYYSDNYASLMPGESRTFDIAFPESAKTTQMCVELRGWNLEPAAIPISH